MNNVIFPTKGNLINAKKSLELSKIGYDLMDKKRNILIREMMSLIGEASKLRDEINQTYKSAYSALQNANITLGICQNIASSVPVDDGISISYRSVMGVDIPLVNLKRSEPKLFYGFTKTNSQLDNAYMFFDKVKRITITLATIENSIYRLAVSITKTQRRANALKNIMIPRFTQTVKYISDALEEKEREEFSRQKVIKNQKTKI